MSVAGAVIETAWRHRRQPASARQAAAVRAGGLLVRAPRAVPHRVSRRRRHTDRSGRRSRVPRWCVSAAVRRV